MARSGSLEKTSSGMQPQVPLAWYAAGISNRLLAGAVVSKEAVLTELETQLANPAFQKDGNLLSDQLASSGRRLLDSDRRGLVDALREWLEARDMTRTLQAVILVTDLHLGELRPLVAELREQVRAGKSLRPFTGYLFDLAVADSSQEEG